MKKQLYILTHLLVIFVFCQPGQVQAQNTVSTELISETGSLKVFTEYNSSNNPLSSFNGTLVGGINNIVKLSTSFGIGYAKIHGMDNTLDMGNNYCCSQVIGFYNRVINSSSGTGIYTEAPLGIHAKGSTAGLFEGDVHVTGNLSKSAGTFKIDHPQDPENKYLVHSFVESPDMMNVYNGNAKTNATGKVTVTLPSYFESLNIDFRYQLTVIGTFAQAIVSKEITHNTFEIATDKPNVKVSWQVTGVRNDPYAKQNRVVAEMPKLKKEKGKFLNPSLYGRSDDESVFAYEKPKKGSILK